MRPIKIIFAVSLFAAIEICGVGTSYGQGPGLSDGIDSEERLALVEFRELPLREAIRLFAEQSGLNVAASMDARERIVSLYLKNVTPHEALTTLTRTHRLYYRTDPDTNIITIYTTEEYETGLQNFRDEKTRVFTMLYPNAIEAAQVIGSLYGTSAIVDYGDSNDQVYQNLTERFNRFDLLDGRSQGIGIFGGGGGGGFGGGGGGGGGFGGGGGGGFGGGGGGGFGGGGGGGFGGGGGLTNGANRGAINQANIQTNRQNGQQNTQQSAEQRLFLPSLDLSNIPPDQIQMIVEAQRGMLDDASRRLFDRLQQAEIFVTVIQKQNQIIVRTSDPDKMDQIAELIRKIDVPTPMVLLEVKIMEIVLDDGFTSTFDYEFSDGNLAAGGFSTGNILPPFNDIFGLGRGGALVPANNVTVDDDVNAMTREIEYEFPLTPNGNALFQLVDTRFRARMQLLESKNRVTTLASPILMTANNEVSRLFVGKEVPLNRGFSGGGTIAAAGGVANGGANTTIEFRPVGTTLLITPSINADRTVTLRILQERSSIDEDGANLQIPDGNGGFTEQTIDTVSSKTYSGTVIAKDGMTLALGGLIDEGVNDNRQAIPILGKLPIVGVLFRDQQTGRGRTELVMTIRPYIFNTPIEASNTSEWLVDELSLHPNAPESRGTMGTYSPHEVLRPKPPTTPLESIFRFHSVEPKVY